jgi:hypothetical protein
MPPWQYSLQIGNQTYCYVLALSTWLWMSKLFHTTSTLQSCNKIKKICRTFPSLDQNNFCPNLVKSMWVNLKERVIKGTLNTITHVFVRRKLFLLSFLSESSWRRIWYLEQHNCFRQWMLPVFFKFWCHTWLIF